MLNRRSFLRGLALTAGGLYVPKVAYSFASVLRSLNGAPSYPAFLMGRLAKDIDLQATTLYFDPRPTYISAETLKVLRRQLTASEFIRKDYDDYEHFRGEFDGENVTFLRPIRYVARGIGSA